jgi:hypothetical protein
VRLQIRVFANACEVGVHGLARLAQAALGPAALAVGFVAVVLRALPLLDSLGPLPGDAGHASADGQQERCRQTRHQRLAPAPAPGPLDPADRPGLDRLASEPTTQVVCQRLGRPEPVGRLLGHRLQADRLQVTRHGAVQVPGRHGILV